MPTAPRKIGLLKELRVVVELVSLLYPRARVVHPHLATQKRHIVIFPGFGLDNRPLRPLTRYLEKHGHTVYDWGLGINDGGMKRDYNISDIADTWEFDTKHKAQPVNTKELGVPYLCTIAARRVLSLSIMLEQPLVLIGWSLGGYIAREIARDKPDIVSQVITMGTPVIGGSKYTATGEGFIKEGMDINWIANELPKRDRIKIQAPITAITGKYDGCIAQEACIDTINPHVHHIEVNTCHMGFGFHYPTWQLILNKLANNVPKTN